VDVVKLRDNVAWVKFKVQADQPVLRSTAVAIRYQNLIGQRYLSLVPGTGAAKPLRDGARIPQDRTEPSFDLSALLNGFEPLFSLLEPNDINKLSDTIIQVLQGSGPAMNTLLTQTAELTTKFASRDEVIGQVLDNLTIVLGHLATKGDQFHDLIVQTQSLVNGLAKNADPIIGAMESIHKVAGNVTGLIQDIRPAVKTDLVKLNQVAGLFLSQGPLVAGTVQELPNFLGELARVTQSGSWLNLYACEIDLGLAGFPSGVVPQLLGTKHTEVCR
jgi:phospholipid/cholesterol/gamma-HCH transport system substrate-binding protein